MRVKRTITTEVDLDSDADVGEALAALKRNPLTAEEYEAYEEALPEDMGDDDSDDELETEDSDDSDDDVDPADSDDDEDAEDDDVSDEDAP